MQSVDISKKNKKTLIPKNSRLFIVGKTSNFVVNVFLACGAITVIFPLLWLFNSSFKTQMELAQNPWGIPSTFTLDNYVNAWVKGRMGRLLTNSSILTIVTIAITVLVSPMIAYVLARMKFKLNHFIYYFVIAGMMVPIHSIVIPIYMNTMKWNMQNNLFTLGTVYAAFRVPISVFILYGFMITIPNELEECAIIDGCGVWKIYSQIMLPLSRDGLISVTILAALSTWNELLLSSLLLSEPKLQSIPVGLMGFISEYHAEFTQLCAGVLIACIPTLVLYAVMQENTIKGMTAGAVKG